MIKSLLRWLAGLGRGTTNSFGPGAGPACTRKCPEHCKPLGFGGPM